MADGNERWYDMAVTPSVDKLYAAVLSLKSGGVPNR
jgi:hypothetical protein